MIQQQTILKVADNSGAKYVKCLKVLGGSKKKFATVGDIIVVAVLSLRDNPKKPSKIKKGSVYKALVIRTKKSIVKKTTVYTVYDNSVVLIDKSKDPIATRLIGPIPLALKKKYIKLITISAGFF